MGLEKKDNDLLPCPFCGCKPYSTRTVNGTEMFKVGCIACGFEFKAAWYRNDEKPTRDLVAAWNTRYK
jgi:Lar family restriction alleviation protein